MSPAPPSWEGRRKGIWNQRLAWFGETPSTDFWAEYWQRRVGADYYAAAVAHDLAADELGRIVLTEMSPHGPHLEAGCGPGFWVAALRSQGLDVEGNETSERVVQTVREVTDLPIALGDARSIDRPNGSYGTYLSFGVIEHDPAGPQAFLAEAHRLLRPGGRIVLTVPYHGPIRRLRTTAWKPRDSPPPGPFYQYGFTAADLTGILGQTGFTVLGTRPLHVHRLLMEESVVYRRLSEVRGFRFVKSGARRLLEGLDGHMIAAWGRRD